MATLIYICTEICLFIYTPILVHRGFESTYQKSHKKNNASKEVKGKKENQREDHKSTCLRGRAEKELQNTSHSVHRISVIEFKCGCKITGN